MGILYINDIDSLHLSGQTLFISGSTDPVKILGLQPSSSDTKVISVDDNGVLHTVNFSGISAGNKYFVQNTAPNLPTLISGDRWFNSDIGIEFVYIVDGDSGQWVEPFTATPDIPNYGTFSISSSTANLLFDYFYYGINYDGPVDLYLPSCYGSDGRFITIKDELGKCDELGKRIRINPYSGETVDNYSFVDMTISKMALQLITRNNNWHII